MNPLTAKNALARSGGEEEEEPLPLLDQLVDELIDWKVVRGQDLEVEWDPEEGCFRVLLGAPVEVIFFTAAIDEQFYGDPLAVVVEADLGTLEELGGAERLLGFAYREQVYSRLALAEEEGLLVLQAALPLGQLSAVQLDGMIREVGALAWELRGDDADDEEG